MLLSRPLYLPALMLAKEAQRARDADDRRRLLDLAEWYKRVADQVATASS